MRYPASKVHIVAGHSNILLRCMGGVGRHAAEVATLFLETSCFGVCDWAKRNRHGHAGLTTSFPLCLLSHIILSPTN